MGNTLLRKVKGLLASVIVIVGPVGCGSETDPQIKMVGVWDTVGSLGIPSLFGGVDPVLYGFLDTGLHPCILNAYHALAIDERRGEFPATLWTSAPAPGQTIEQVWFTGVHCDVGGSYPNDPDGTALSDITLGWMMSKALALGVKFDASVLMRNPFPGDPKYALDQKHESWNLLWAFPRRRPIAADARIANSVSVRCQHDNSYRPENLLFSDSAKGILAAQYQITQTVLDAPAAAQAAASKTST